MLDVLLEVIAPVLAVAVIGGAVGRRIGITAPALSPLAFYLFSPALVFDSLSTVQLAGSDTARIVFVTAAGAVVLLTLSFGASAVLGHDRHTRSAVALGSAMSNSGNLGLPVSLLAFGEPGLSIAIIAFVTSAAVVNSLGVVVASYGSGSLRDSVRALVGVPALWAAGAALAVNAQQTDLPAVVTESAHTLAGASIPVMLVVLGLQLRLDVSRDGLGELVTSVGIKLLAGPAVAYGLCLAIGLDGVTRNALVVLGGMPAAVFTTILATQFGARPLLVSRAVVVSTLASVMTLTALIARFR